MSDENQTLNRTLAGGLAWTAGAKWATQIFSWGSLVITARLLSRADYGVGEMAGFFFALTNTLAEFGVGSAALHMTELDEGAIRELHGFSLLLCSGVYVISILLAPLIAQFFHKPELVLVIVVSNLTFFVTGFQAVPTGLLQRDMDYRRLSISEGSLYMVQSAVTVIGAWLGWGYWALVIGTLAGKTANAAVLLLWKPVSFAWPRVSNIRAAINFGRQAAAGNLAATAYSHADVLVIGRMMGDSALGTYRMALYVVSAPAEKISMLIMRMAGPLFANLQSDRVLLRRYFLLLADTLMLVILPAMVGLIMVAPDAIQVLLGSQWRESAKPLSWLAVYMIFATLHTLATQVLVSQRFTAFTMRISFANLLILPVAFIIGARWNGVTGLAAAWVCAAPLTFLPTFAVLLRRIDLSWRECLKVFFPSWISAAAMWLGVAAVQKATFLGTMAPAARLCVEVAAGALVYSGTLLVFFPDKCRRYVRFARNAMRGGAEQVTSPAAEASAARNV